IVGVATKPVSCLDTKKVPACVAGGTTWVIPIDGKRKHETIGICEQCKDNDCDADSDSRANEADNCPVTANHDQRDQNNNSIRDVCEPPTTLRVAVDDWLRGILPDPRFVDFVKKHPELFGPPTIGGNHPLPTWSTSVPVISDSLKAYARSYLNGQVSEARF